MVLQRKQKVFRNLWTKWNNLKPCRSWNFNFHQNKNHPTTMASVILVWWQIIQWNCHLYLISLAANLLRKESWQRCFCDEVLKSFGSRPICWGCGWFLPENANTGANWEKDLQRSCWAHNILAMLEIWKCKFIPDPTLISKRQVDSQRWVCAMC